MKCPECARDSALVIDSRPTGIGRRRRYQCQCGARFSTIETLAHRGTMPHTGLRIHPEEIRKWRTEALDEIEAALAQQLADIRRGYGIAEDEVTS